MGRRLLPGIEIIKHHYFDEQLSSEKIAKIYNFSPSAICAKMKRFGVTLRTLNEADLVKPLESKRCRYCGSTFFSRDFPRMFHVMITCGSEECKKKHGYQWQHNKPCPDCGVMICRESNYCEICSTLGTRNPFYGKTHTDEAKTKIKLFPKGHTPWIKGKHHGVSSKLRNSVAHQKGDVVRPLHFGNNLRNAIRSSPAYKEWRRKVFSRDDYTCQNKQCGKRAGRLEAHHKIPFKKLFKAATSIAPLFTDYDACMAYAPFWDINNGITLCVKCHRRKDGGFVCKPKQHLKTEIANGSKI